MPSDNLSLVIRSAIFLALAPIANVNRLRNFGEGPSARAAVEALVGSLPTPDQFGVGFRAHLILAEMIEEEGKAREGVEEYQRALSEPNPPHMALTGAFVRLARAARAANMTDLAIEAATQEQTARRSNAQTVCPAGADLALPNCSASGILDSDVIK